jgi:hypothetical protein
MPLLNSTQQVTKCRRVRQVKILIGYANKLLYLKIDDLDADRCRSLKKTNEANCSEGGSSGDYGTNYLSQETSFLQFEARRVWSVRLRVSLKHIRLCVRLVVKLTGSG